VKPRERIEAILKNIDALSMRERVFVLAGMLMVIGAIWQGLLNGPLEARSQAAQNNVTATSERLSQLDEAIAVAAAGLDGGIGNRVEMLQSLREAVAAREEELRVFTSDLIDPGQMRLVVEDLIKRQSSLELIRTQNTRATPLLDIEESDQADAQDEPNLYLHGLIIELEGSYLDLLAYLESIEQLPWRIFYSRLDLEAIDHPKLKITLELNTLSLEKEWLGV
jgi:MSHA biogenesis protein MshJ